MNSMRFKMVATYFIGALAAMALLSVYIIGTLRINLYENETADIFAKANMVSGSIAVSWDNFIYAEDLKFEVPVKESLAGTNARCVVTNAAYVALYDTNEDSDAVGNVFTRSTVKEALEGRETHEIARSDSGESILSVAVPITFDDKIVGSVYITENTDYIDRIVSSLRNGMAIFGVLICLAIAALSFVMSVKVTAPVNEFSDVAREISKGNFKKRIELKGYSELEQMAKSLNYMCDELELTEQKRRKFVSDASHELKTPMATIKLVCDSLVATPNPPADTVQEFMLDLSNEIDRLTRIIDKLLTLTRYDDGRSPLKPELVDLQMLVERVAANLTPAAAKKKINIYTDFGEEAMPPIMLDYDKIWEAVYNIADNAVKYSPTGSYVRISAKPDGKDAVIKIEDNGPGIPESERTNIFERFYRLDDSRARDTGGTGLGLAIAKEAVALHGGVIEVRDTVNSNSGSVFTIRLPEVL